MTGKGAIVTRRQLAAAMLAGVISALVAVGVASGGQGPFAYTFAMGTVANNTQNDAISPSCQSPVAGGGVYLSGPDLGAEVNSSSPWDSPSDANQRPDGWQGYGINDGSGGPYSIRVDVICSQSVEVLYRDKAFEIPANSHRTGRRACPGDTVAFSGGVYVANGGLDDELGASFPYDDGDPGKEPDDGWAGTANAGAGAGSMTVHAICSPSRGFRYVERAEVGKPGDQYTIKARCRESEQLAGGGARVSKPGQNAEIASLHPFDDDDQDQSPDDGFQGWANNQGPQADRKLTTFAICR